MGVAPSYVHGKGTTRPHYRNHTRRVCVRGSIGSSERRVERAHVPPTDSVIGVQRSSVNGSPRLERPLERTDMRLSVVRFLRKQVSRFNGQHYGARVTPLSIRHERYTCISLSVRPVVRIYVERANKKERRGAVKESRAEPAFSPALALTLSLNACVALLNAATI